MEVNYCPFLYPSCSRQFILQIDASIQVIENPHPPIRLFIRPSITTGQLPLPILAAAAAASAACCFCILSSLD